MHRRINITLPEETVKLIDRISERGDRSRLINQAVRRYIQEVGRAELRRRLREGYRKGAESDRELAEAWFLVDEEAWQRELP
ncbi:MAG: ribbon-helix-helix domain-containing protein [Terriglobales bacterium]